METLPAAALAALARARVRRLTLDTGAALDRALAQRPRLRQASEAAALLVLNLDIGPHERPEAPVFTSMTDELRALLTKWDRVFLFGDFSTHPPLFRRQETGINAGKCYQEQSGGGPLITLDLALLSSEGPPTLISGSLSTQPLYQLEPGRWERPGPALKDAYADISKRMKKHLKRYQGEWIAPKALQLLQAGKVQLPAGLPIAPARHRAPSNSSTPPASPLPRAAAGQSLGREATSLYTTRSSGRGTRMRTPW